MHCSRIHILASRSIYWQHTTSRRFLSIVRTVIRNRNLLLRLDRALYAYEVGANLIKKNKVVLMSCCLSVVSEIGLRAAR